MQLSHGLWAKMPIEKRRAAFACNTIGTTSGWFLTMSDRRTSGSDAGPTGCLPGVASCSSRTQPHVRSTRWHLPCGAHGVVSRLTVSERSRYSHAVRSQAGHITDSRRLSEQRAQHGVAVTENSEKECMSLSSRCDTPTWGREPHWSRRTGLDWTRNTDGNVESSQVVMTSQAKPSQVTAACARLER